jgi:hypothetical protein
MKGVMGLDVDEICQATINIARKNYESTAGCIALKKADLIILTKKIKKNTKIII